MKNRNIGPHSRRHRLGKIDKRTFEGKLYEQFRAELTEHCGGAPDIVQRSLIERAAWVKLRCAMLDARITSGNFTESDSKTYLAWTNTLRRTLIALNAEASTAASKTPNLADYLTGKYGDAA